MSASLAKKQMTDAEIYGAIASEIQEITGVQLGEKQESLVSSRVTRRLRTLKMGSLNDYYSYFLQNRSKEINPLVSLLTTHHTFFFREFVHFEFLLKTLPDVVKKAKAEGRNKIHLWSAASSYGHEVYSLAMFLSFHLPKIDPNMDFEVFGTDVCEDSVERGKKGIYRWEELKKVPRTYITGNWMKGTGDIENFVKANGKIKEKCSFAVNNLQSFGKNLNGKKFDYIFCRNVFIYFSAEQILKICSKMKEYMYEDSYLVLGLSESISESVEYLEPLGKSSFQYSTKKVEEEPKVEEVSNAEVTKRLTSDKIRVLCVDDSPTVLKILQKILDSDDSFEVVGTAKNGIEAAKVVKTLSFDVMTLDIHMPEKNGVDYLKDHFKDNHPPVVIVSSVSADDADLAMKTFDYGATDYVEKPTLENFSEKGEEIMRKLKTAHMFNAMSGVNDNTLNIQFSKKLTLRNVDEKLKIVFAGMSERKKLEYILKHYEDNQPAMFILFENIGELKDKIQSELQIYANVRISKFENGDTISPNNIYLADHTQIEFIKGAFESKKTVAMVLSDISEKTASSLKTWNRLILSTEDTHLDRSKVYGDLSRRASFKIQYTSFNYESDLYLDKDEES